MCCPLTAYYRERHTPGPLIETGPSPHDASLTTWLPGPEPLFLMGSGPNQPFSYSLHLLRGRDISTHVPLLRHRDRVLPRPTRRPRSSWPPGMTSLLHGSCPDRLSHLTGSSVISRACSTLSLSLRVEDYTSPSHNVYLGQRRFSRDVGCIGDRPARAVQLAFCSRQCHPFSDMCVVIV
jgi:hypothetical protein